MKRMAMGSAFAETTWTDAFRRVRNRIALVAAAICAAAAPLSSQADTGPLNGTPDDVRVAPLLTTHWAQGSVGNNKLCYNYYTPLNRVCGCTATAIGQIMYYHRYPTERILPGEYLYDDIDEYGKYFVYQNGTGGMTNTTTGVYTEFDPPYGGPYRWSDMVDSPDGHTESEAARSAIGQLTRDAGFAEFSHYFVGETSGYTAAIASGLILNLHYADAVRTGFDANKFIANIDAGLPVQVGLTGHAVVADGYGYHNGKLYIHINYGHGGTNSGWYDPTSTIGSGNKNLQDMVANIFPPTRGARHSSVISGRILDANGNPVANGRVHGGRRRAELRVVRGVRRLGGRGGPQLRACRRKRQRHREQRLYRPCEFAEDTRRGGRLGLRREQQHERCRYRRVQQCGLREVLA